MSLTCHFVYWACVCSEETLYRTFYRCFLPNFNWFGQMVLEMNRMHCTRPYNEHSSQVCFQTKKKVCFQMVWEKDFKRTFSVKSYVKLCTAISVIYSLEKNQDCSIWEEAESTTTYSGHKGFHVNTIVPWKCF